MVKYPTLFLGLCFFAAHAMDRDNLGQLKEQATEKVKNEIRDSKRFRNGFASAAGMLFLPFMSLFSVPIDPLLGPALSIGTALTVSGLSGYCSYLCHKQAKIKTTESGQSFNDRRSFAKMAVNCALGVSAYAGIMFLL